MSEHTPGPWTAEYHGKERHAILCGHEHLNDVRRSEIIAEITDPFVFVPRAERSANAHLLAAAPDLLAAMPTINHPGGRLVKVVAHYESGATQTIDGEVVTAAIAKAEGTRQ